jgi:hypothetical protein
LLSRRARKFACGHFVFAITRRSHLWRERANFRHDECLVARNVRILGFGRTSSATELSPLRKQCDIDWRAWISTNFCFVRVIELPDHPEVHTVLSVDRRNSGEDTDTTACLPVLGNQTGRNRGSTRRSISEVSPSVKPKNQQAVLAKESS